METNKQLKFNYCRLPAKSRAEKLFDQIVSKPAFTDLSNKIVLQQGEIKSKSQRKVPIVTYSGKKGVIGAGDGKKGPVKRKTCQRKKVPPCTKEAVLDAFLKAGLPDYDAIAALPLNVVVMDERETEEKKKSPPTSEEPERSLRFLRRSIVETAHHLHAAGKSCRTIVRISPPVTTRRRTTRKRRNTIIENSSVSFLVAFDKTFVADETKDIPLTAKEKVLSLCDPPNITTFDNALDANLIESMCKIGEGSYGEVFKSKTAEDQEVVVKVVPLLNHSGEEETWKQILPELVISLTFGELRTGLRNKTPNFINTLRASCASGCWPKQLVHAWEDYHLNRVSENVHPNKYELSSNWLILLLSNGGIELENYPFTSATQSLSVILQTIISLAAAEEEFEFEHRDLHTGNVLVMPCEETELEYKVDNKLIKIPSKNVKISVIDFTLARMAKDGYIVYDDLSKYEDIFTGEGDYQFEIYRLMRQANGNDWKTFTPYTNILWVHYLSMKMITDRSYKSRSKVHQASFKTLKSLQDNLLNYTSTSQFVKSSYFNTIISQFT